MKDILLNLLKNTQEDATFLVDLYNPDGTFKSETKNKFHVQSIIQKAKEIKKHPSRNHRILVDGNIGLSTKSISENIDYNTENTEGFKECVSRFNQYYNVFIKLDEGQKTITFKLGNKEKTMKLLENTGFVSQPYNNEYLKCESVVDLKKRIMNKFWNPRMVDVGREVLGLKELVFM